MEIFNLKSPELKKDKNELTLEQRVQKDPNKPYLVTAIKPAVKTENRANIFINERFSFSLAVAQVVDLSLKVGKWLSPAELNECKHASEFGKLYHHALEYTLTRPHSTKEVRDHLVKRRQRRELANMQAIKNRSKDSVEIAKYKLQTKELPLYTDEDIEETINRLTEKKYLDDKYFTNWYIENRFYKKGISAKRLRQELSLKGIPKEIVDLCMATNGRDEKEEIKKIISRKAKRYTKEKLIAYLVRQGFDYQQSKAAVLEMDSQN